MNPRYVLFLDTQPNDVSAASFRTWVLSKWFEWEKISGHGWDMPHRPEDHAAFDAWLTRGLNRCENAEIVK